MGEAAVQPADEEVRRAVEFVERLIALDMALTGRSYKECSGALHEQRDAAASSELFAHVYADGGATYRLSDGGASGVYWEAPELRLAQRSGPIVAVRWGACLREREAVEEMLAAVAGG